MNLRRLLILFGTIGLCIVVVASLGDLPVFVHTLIGLRWYVVPLFIVVQLVGYYANARYYQAFFGVSGAEVGLGRLYQASLAINFANQVLPSGGVAGTAYLAEAIKGKAAPGVVTLAQLGRYFFTFVAYFVTLVLGLILLMNDGGTVRPAAQLIVVVMVLILTGAVVSLWTLGRRRRVEVIVHPIVRLVNAVFRRFAHRTLIEAASLERFLDELYHGYSELKRRRRAWWALFGWSFVYNLVEVATVYVVFIGFGDWIDPGIVVAGYAMAIIASIAGVVTGGVGVYELGMIGTFAALGVPFAESVSVVLVYRSLSMILFLPPGLYFYHRHLRTAEEAS